MQAWIRTHTHTRAQAHTTHTRAQTHTHTHTRARRTRLQDFLARNDGERVDAADALVTQAVKRQLARHVKHVRGVGQRERLHVRAKMGEREGGRNGKKRDGRRRLPPFSTFIQQCAMKRLAQRSAHTSYHTHTRTHARKHAHTRARTHTHTRARARVTSHPTHHITHHIAHMNASSHTHTHTLPRYPIN